ncbi:MAG: glycosyltransferase [Elusimicrobia bacterium]|nr:glycosyltransferase [Elusimicrobiota bacterium]
MLEATLHGLCWLAGFWMLWRLAALPKGDAAVDFSVIIPARDEARRLPALLESLQNQSLRPLEILVVDDHSTDGTTDVARRVGARVIASAPLPAGWRGKTWACQQGAREARGPWLLFLDADLRLLPGALARIAAAARANRGPFRSCPTIARSDGWRISRGSSTSFKRRRPTPSPPAGTGPLPNGFSARCWPFPGKLFGRWAVTSRSRTGGWRISTCRRCLKVGASPWLVTPGKAPWSFACTTAESRGSRRGGENPSSWAARARPFPFGSPSACG